METQDKPHPLLDPPSYNGHASSISWAPALELSLVDPLGLPDHTVRHGHCPLTTESRIQNAAWKGNQAGAGQVTNTV